MRVKRYPERTLASKLTICTIVCLLVIACSGPQDTVRGVIVAVEDRNLAEIDTLTIRDDDGQEWTFATIAALEKNGAHLRLHQVLGQTIEVQFEEREGTLVAIALRD